MEICTTQNLFSASVVTDMAEFESRTVSRIEEELNKLPDIINKAYIIADEDISILPAQGVRRNSMATRVNECISYLCAEAYPQYHREVKHGKFLLHIPGIAQMHILKTHNGKLTPRRTKQARYELNQQRLEYNDCPIMHIGHEMKYGKLSVTLQMYAHGNCLFSVPLSDMISQSERFDILNAITITEPSATDEVFARPKANATRLKSASGE